MAIILLTSFAKSNGVKGKAKIEIRKATEGRNGNIVPGVYYGRDITGQSEWMLDIESGGKGTFGEVNVSGNERNTILFTNEQFTEFNDAMGKMAGMTGFMKAYLGPPESELKYTENFNIRESGMSSAYMPMPNHGVFVYIPPILFEYAGRRVSASQSQKKDEEIVRTEKTGIVLQQDKLVGDGRSRTKAVFHYEDEHGVPVAGKSITWFIPKGIKLISSETVTDAMGNAVAVIEAPLLKATDEKRGDFTGEIIDNYDLFLLKAGYNSGNDKQEYTETTFSVYKVIERNMYVLKPGIEPLAFKVQLPQLENFTLESSVFAQVEMLNSPSIPEKIELNDAVVMIEKRKFDKERYEGYYNEYFRKDRAFFLTLMDNDKGGFCAVTGKNGRFKMLIGGETGKKLSIEPIQAKIADLAGRRAGSLGEALSFFSDQDFVIKVKNDLFTMEKSICTGTSTEAWYIEEKLHVIGVLMTNIKGTSRYMRDCAKTFGTQSYEAFKFLLFFAAEQFKFNEKLMTWVGNTNNGAKLKDAGISIEKYLISNVGGQDANKGTANIIKRFLYAQLSEKKVQASQGYYQLLGHAANYVLTEKQKQIMDAVVDAVVYYLPYPDKIADLLIKEYYAGQMDEIKKLLDQNPAKIHAIYDQLQPALRDRSTDIRQQYQDVASWRYNLDMFKAYTDLFADLVVKAAVIIWDAKTMNYAALKKHMDYIDNVKSALNGAYHAASVMHEFQSYRNLWAESDAAFIYANKCIEQGVMSPVTLQNNSSFSLFPLAMAAKLPEAEAMQGVPALNTGELLLKNGKLPVAVLNKMYNGYPDFENWFSRNEKRLQYLSVSFPDESANLLTESEKYRNQLLELTMLTVSYIDNPQDAQLVKQWNDVSGKLTSSSAQLLKYAGIAVAKMKELPDNPTVGSPETSSVSPVTDKTLAYVFAGIALLLLLVLTIFIIRRKRKSRKRLSLADAPDRFMVQTPPPSAKTHVQPAGKQSVNNTTLTPKFCPKCGSPLKPGAKFCGKCGHRF